MRRGKFGDGNGGAKIYALAGTLGSGKTSSIIPLIEALKAQGVEPANIAVVMIDTAGVGEMYSEINSCVRLEVLPNGCFTCGDPDVVRKRIGILEKAGVRHIILEGFGVISGDEIVATLAQLERPCDIIACLDGRQFERNCELGLEALIGSHVAVATMGVLVTKIAVPSQKMIAFLKRCGNDQRWSTSAAPSFPEVWQRDLLRRRPVPRFAAVVVDVLRHSDAAVGVHGWPDIAFRLCSGVTIEDLQASFTECVASGAVSLKGVVHGIEFRAVPGADIWDCKISQAQSNVVVLYLKPGTPESLIVPCYTLFDERLPRSYEVVRSGKGDPAVVADFLRRFVEENVSQVPIVSSVSKNKLALVTHPEGWQLMKELARRTSQVDEWFLPVMQVFIQYWLRCGQVLVEKESDFEAYFLATHQRELGVSLAWWVHRFGVSLSRELLAEVYRANPAYLVARGILALEALRTDDFWRFWQALEYLRALSFGLDYLTEAEKQEVDSARERVYSLASTPEEVWVWQEWMDKNTT